MINLQGAFWFQKTIITLWLPIIDKFADKMMKFNQKEAPPQKAPQAPPEVKKIPTAASLLGLSKISYQR